MCKGKTYKDEEVVRDLEMTYIYMGYHCGDKEIADLVKTAAINYMDDMIHEMAAHLSNRPDKSVEKQDYLQDSYVTVTSPGRNSAPTGGPISREALSCTPLKAAV